MQMFIMQTRRETDDNCDSIAPLGKCDTLDKLATSHDDDDHSHPVPPEVAP